MRRSALLAVVTAFAVLSASAAPDHKRLPSPAGTPSPLNAYRDRPTVLDTAPPPRGFQVLAFGVNLDPINGNTFVHLDAANPSNVIAIAPTSRNLIGGAFANTNFARFYVIDSDTSELLWLDSFDGSEHVVGTLAGAGLGQTWTGLTTFANSFLYGSVTDLTGDNPSSQVYIIDASSGATQLVADLGPGRVVDIAARPDLQVFAVDTLSDTLRNLQGTIGPLGFDAEYAAVLDFAPNGTLYLAAIDNQTPTFQPDQMYRVNTTTGDAVLVGGISADPAGAELSAFAIVAAAPICSEAEDIPWISETPTAATTTPGTSTPVTMTFDASTLAPGEYSAYLCVTSNDPGQPMLHVPVDLTVE